MHFAGTVLLQIGVLIVGLCIYIGIVEKFAAKLPKHWQQLIFAVFAVVWSALNSWIWRQTRERTIKDLKLIEAFMNWGVSNVIVALAVFIAGWLAYRGKQIHRFRYGVVEILVAMVTAMISASGIDAAKPDTFTRVATIIGCVYIVSRGWENMTEYKAKP
jgi:cation transport ATPase